MNSSNKAGFITNSLICTVGKERILIRFVPDDNTIDRWLVSIDIDTKAHSFWLSYFPMYKDW